MSAGQRKRQQTLWSFPRNRPGPTGVIGSTNPTFVPNVSAVFDGRAVNVNPVVSGRYYLQIGSFNDVNSANMVYMNLVQRGIALEQVSNGSIINVYAGPLCRSRQ
ncbi:MAG: SPOR domain-containing protein [Deinococcales bacterium]